MTKFLPSSADKYYGIAAMVRRLVMEEGVRHWKKYAVAFVLMGVTAGCTSLIPYLFGQIVNQTEIHRSMTGGLIGAGLVFLLFVGKGVAAYGQSVILARIANRILASH